MASIKNLRFDDLIPKVDPTEGMNWGEKALAGAGKAFWDIGRGAQQLVGNVPRAEIDEERRLAEPLMKTGGGITGNILGNLAAVAPLAVIPGAATVPGAAIAGAGLGAIEPLGTGDGRGENVLRSAALSAAVPAATTLFKGGKALAEPFYKGGRDKITGRTIERFAGDDAARKINSAAGELVQGSRPTLAEATQDAGIATLQRSAVASDPRLAKAIDGRELQNNAARVQALRSIGGDEGELAFNKASRATAAKELYERAFAEAPADTQWIKGEITKLMKRPGFVSAMKDGQEIAANEGLRVGKKGKFLVEDATRILHYTKMAIDDKIADATGNAQRALIDTRNKVVSLMESKDFAPSYREARDTFKQMSGPINRMEVGQELARRSLNNVDDALGNPTLTPARFGSVLKGGDDVVGAATGRPRPMGEVLEPQQVELLEMLRKDLSRLNVSRTAGKPMGSPTAQYLSSQNLMQQIAGPLGMPKSFAESTLLRSAARPVDWAFKRAEPDVQEALAKALLDPEEAKRIMALIQARQAGLLGKMSKGGPYVSGLSSGLLAVSPNATE